MSSPTIGSEALPEDIVLQFGPTTVSTAGASVVFPGSPRPLQYLRIYNPAPSQTNGVTISRANPNPVANGEGTITLLGGQFEEWKAPGPVPTNPVYAIGTVSTTQPITVEWA